jgi:hypothetical protein
MIPPSSERQLDRHNAGYFAPYIDFVLCATGGQPEGSSRDERPARRRILDLDATWPWAGVILRGLQRLHALPTPG